MIVARDIALQLSDLGYDPLGHAGSADQAVRLVAELRPDLVLMDIQLAGPIDGITAAQTIRAQFSVPVVFLTAFAADDVLERAILAEPYGYIVKPFSRRDLRTVLAMALYKHKTDEELRNNARQMRALSRRVLEVQEAERRRLAHELHDELGQSLTAIKINLQAHERFKGQTPAELNAENLRIVEEILENVRRLALALRPSVLDDLGLAPALRWMGEQSAARGGFVVRFQPEIAGVRLAPEMETACFRIAQEALTNITRHAKAQRVDIQLLHDGATLVLSVRDDGCGFDLSAAHGRAAAGDSIGVLGMRERAMLIGGQLDIETTPGQGSMVRLRCPLRLPADLP